MVPLFRPLYLFVSVAVAAVALASCSTGSVPPAPTSMLSAQTGLRPAAPPNLAGKWNGKYKTGTANGTFTMQLMQTKDKVTGTITIGTVQFNLRGVVKGTRVDFGITCSTAKCTGKGEVKGTVNFGGTAMKGSGKCTLNLLVFLSTSSSRSPQRNRNAWGIPVKTAF